MKIKRRWFLVFQGNQPKDDISFLVSVHIPGNRLGPTNGNKSVHHPGLENGR